VRFKLDENLGRSVAEALRKAGHEAATVAEERLEGASDRQVLKTAQAEARCLVTLDVEFGNPLLFHPGDYGGIVVIRLPPRGTTAALGACVEALLAAVSRAEVSGMLWIVQPGRVREYQPER